MLKGAGASEKGEAMKRNMLIVVMLFFNLGGLISSICMTYANLNENIPLIIMLVSFLGSVIPYIILLEKERKRIGLVFHYSSKKK
ncbi:hypothetical protein HYT26_04860 [Candidatus Pacearchaeota archaeon]|nr:hypothetical protein [Candidatus Pacearchaeota archaeon]